MNRHRIGFALSIAVLGVVGMLGLTACGLRSGGNAGTDAGQDSIDVAANLSPEAQALVALGFEPAAVDAKSDTTDAVPAAVPSTAPSGKPSAGPGGNHRNRVFLRRHVLHGEAVVQTKEGNKNVAVQRGSVTAVTDTSVTVKSTDGYTQTWTFASQLIVLEHRTTIQPSAIKVGTEVGVAGPHDGSTYTAKLVVVP